MKSWTTNKQQEGEDESFTFLYVVSPEASTLLWPIFFSWAGPAPNGDGICHKERNGKCKYGCYTAYVVFQSIWGQTEQIDADDRREREEKTDKTDR